MNPMVRMQGTASLTFVFTSLPSSHHLPEIWHDGDECEYESRDFAVLQVRRSSESIGSLTVTHFQSLKINSVRERTYFERGLEGSLFKRAIAAPLFAHHALHHTFPTVSPLVSSSAQLLTVWSLTGRPFATDEIGTHLRANIVGFRL